MKNKKPKKETPQERLKRERGLLREIRGPQRGLGTREHEEERKNPKDTRRKWKQRRFKGDLGDI